MSDDKDEKRKSNLEKIMEDLRNAKGERVLSDIAKRHGTLGSEGHEDISDMLSTKEELLDMITRLHRLAWDLAGTRSFKPGRGAKLMLAGMMQMFQGSAEAALYGRMAGMPFELYEKIQRATAEVALEDLPDAGGEEKT